MASIVLRSATAFAATPMSYLQSFWAQGRRILGLTQAVLAISIIVVIVMTALVLWAIFRRRTPAADRDLARQTRAGE